MRPKGKLPQLLLCFLLLLLLTSCIGQDTLGSEDMGKPSYLSPKERANLVGTVSDAETGGPVPGAFVAIAGGGQVFNTTSDEEGAFFLNNIPAGRYAALTVFTKGHEMKVLHDVELEPNQTKKIEFRLRPRGN